jgi:hypothetical protein
MTDNTRMAKVIEQSGQDETAEVMAEITEDELTQLIRYALKQPEAALVDSHCEQVLTVALQVAKCSSSWGRPIPDARRCRGRSF